MQEKNLGEMPTGQMEEAAPTGATRTPDMTGAGERFRATAKEPIRKELIGDVPSGGKMPGDEGVMHTEHPGKMPGE